MEPHATERALADLEAALASVGAPLLRHLQPGSAAEEIEAELEPLPAVHAHPDLLTWYGWHDGTDLPQPLGPYGVAYEPGQRFFGHWYLLGSADAAPCHRRLYDDSRASGHPEYYPDGWFPVLQYLGGGFLCLDTTPGTGGRLHVHDAHADLPGDPPRTQFEDLGTMATVLADLLASGVAAWSDAEQGVVVDPARLPERLRDRPHYW